MFSKLWINNLFIEKIPQIFLSYNSRNRDIADKIDKTFTAIGVSMIRDERDLAYKGSIVNFMIEGVRNNDFTLLLISDEYLKSEYCIFEAGEVFKIANFEKKMLPVVLENASFFSAESRKAYYDYWDDKIKATSRDVEKYYTPDFEDQLKRFQTVRTIIADMFLKLHDFKLNSFTQLETANYKPLFQLIGIDAAGLLQKCIEVVNMQDADQQIIALDELQDEYKNNPEVAFSKALIYLEQKRFVPGRKFCEDYIAKFDYDVQTVHYNLGVILEREFKDYKTARKEYETAISIKPSYAYALNNLGILLIKQFQDYDGARRHFEQAILTNPTFGQSYRNLAYLLKDQFHDFDNAEKNFREAIRLDATDFAACFLCAEMAEKDMQNYSLANDCYLHVIQLNPGSFDAHYKRAQLLDLHNINFIAAAKEYNKAIEIQPGFVSPYVDMAILQFNKFGDITAAERYLTDGLKIDPENDAANYYYALLLANSLHDPFNACKHYKMALQKRDAWKNEQLDSLCAGISNSS